MASTKSTVSPWEKMPQDGPLSIITTGFRSGSQAGSFVAEAPSSVPDFLGIEQTISSSSLEAGKSYKLSAWYLLAQSDCLGNPFLLCGYGWQNLAVTAPLVQNTDYSQSDVTCSWTQDQLDAGPNIQISGFNIDVNIDNVILEKVVQQRTNNGGIVKKKN
ncbi:hypothetical protein ACHAPD_010353 [Fusarium lateritium]